ncbi:MAG TPA: helix-turn-helix domain-containing protein [Gemmataceae bacterium]|nr:helix-turn-helix domain-containing protein [Gemmataceae bacterium]
MIGKKLHEFDLQLCEHVLANIRGHRHVPGFAAFIEEQLDPPMMAYLKALDGDVEPPPLLLNDAELEDLAMTFLGESHEFDRPWRPYAELYRRAIQCAVDIRTGLAAEYVREWARACTQFAERLESGRLWLGDGIEVVAEWIDEVRRLLRAMGATNLLPVPEGTFPTPSHPQPTPPPPPEPPTVPHAHRNDDLAATVAEIRDLLVNQRTVKEVYTTAEVAEILGRSEYTVREWARKGQVQAVKSPNGRSWLISHAELSRLRNHGPTPEHQADGVVDG